MRRGPRRWSGTSRFARNAARFSLQQTAVWDALDEWEPPPVSMDFNRRLWQRIDRAAEVPWYRGLFNTLRRGKLEAGVSDGGGGAGDSGRLSCWIIGARAR